MTKVRKGFMNVFFLGGLMVILLCALVLTDEAGRMRIKRSELESMLAFDYRVEAYYLLIESGAIAADEEKIFGSLSSYELVSYREGENYIMIEKLEDKVLITGHFNGRERCYYEIAQSER